MHRACIGIIVSEQWMATNNSHNNLNPILLYFHDTMQCLWEIIVYINVMMHASNTVFYLIFFGCKAKNLNMSFIHSFARLNYTHGRISSYAIHPLFYYHSYSDPLRWRWARDTRISLVRAADCLWNVAKIAILYVSSYSRASIALPHQAKMIVTQHAANSYHHHRHRSLAMKNRTFYSDFPLIFRRFSLQNP